MIQTYPTEITTMKMSTNWANQVKQVTSEIRDLWRTEIDGERVHAFPQWNNDHKLINFMSNDSTFLSDQQMILASCQMIFNSCPNFKFMQWDSFNCLICF